MILEISHNVIKLNTFEPLNIYISYAVMQLDFLLYQVDTEC